MVKCDVNNKGSYMQQYCKREKKIIKLYLYYYWLSV